ncbi:MAG: isocitrate/isopropylmalate dehydrogenase family protein [Planctomycetes bacterium]|nr:isocitrate/isopropylmalate dehydrogenase family protein [Planctomycetota bacterium]
MKEYQIASLPGDGIGPEVIDATVAVIEAAGKRFGFSPKFHRQPYGAEYYLKNKVGLPESGMRELADYDVMLLGAIGDPRVPPGPLEQEILLALRFHFDQYVNLRPALNFPNVPLPVTLPDGVDLDVVIVRENTEDLYMGMGGGGTGLFSTTLGAERGLYQLYGNLQVEMTQPLDAAFSVGFMTRPAIERVTRYAGNLARQRGEKRVVVVSKANAVPHLYGFWDKVTAEVMAKEFPDLEYSRQNVDAICYLMAMKPAGWGVVLCPNLFGDIVSDLMSGLAGGLGLAAAGNIGDGLSMFEPVHGSAPTIAGTGKANPLAAILSGAMLLRHVGEKDAAAAVEKTVRDYLASGRAMPIEQGGSAVTQEVAKNVVEMLLQ